MRFGSWFPLERATDHAPDGPGVLEIRAEGLRQYPRGKSAMVLYVATESNESLGAFCKGRGQDALTEAQRVGGVWVRFGTTDTPTADGARRIRDFVERFGAPPGAFKS